MPYGYIYRIVGIVHELDVPVGQSNERKLTSLCRESWGSFSCQGCMISLVPRTLIRRSQRTHARNENAYSCAKDLNARQGRYVGESSDTVCSSHALAQVPSSASHALLGPLPPRFGLQFASLTAFLTTATYIVFQAPRPEQGHLLGSCIPGH